MEGIVALVMDAYRELCEQGGFVTQPPEEVLEMIRLETDTVYKFLTECCIEDPEGIENQDDVYDAYVEFAMSEGAIYVMRKNEFTIDLHGKGYGRRRLGNKDDSGKRPYGYTGLTLKDEARIEEEERKKFDADAILKGEKKKPVQERKRKASKVFNNRESTKQGQVRTLDEQIEDKKRRQSEIEKKRFGYAERQSLFQEDDVMEED
jgi:phage/plasmid-associated DNA primase